MGQVVPLYLPVDDEPQFPRIPLVDDGPAHPTLAHLKARNPEIEIGGPSGGSGRVDGRNEGGGPSLSPKNPIVPFPPINP